MALFKKKPEYIADPITVEQVGKLATYAFSIDNGNGPIKFYEFSTLFDMPVKRYQAFNYFLEDYQRGVSNEELLSLVDQCIEDLNGNTVESITNTHVRLKWLKSRAEISHDIDLIMRILSCVFFTVDEDLTQYDHDIAEWKIKLFEKHGVEAFFLSQPIKKYWRSINMSKEDISKILKQRREKRKALNNLRKMGVLTVMDTLESKKETDSS